MKNSSKVLFPILLAVVLLTPVFNARAISVGIEHSNAKPVYLTDENGDSYNSTNTLEVTSQPPVLSTITQGRKSVAVAGTPEPVAGSPTGFNRCVFTAFQDNTDVIVIGSNTVDATLATRTGLPLFSMESFTILNGDLADINVDVEVSGEGLTFYCEN